MVAGRETAWVLWRTFGADAFARARASWVRARRGVKKEV
jgi:hypothetical protein